MPEAKLKVEYVPTDRLAVYENNSKLHPSWQVDQIADSIDQFMFNAPIGAWHDADGTAVVVSGHGRLLAAKKLGMEKVPVIFLDHLDSDARRAYGIVENQLTMNTGFDFSMLDKEFEELREFDWDGFGFHLGGAFDAIEDLMTEEFSKNSMERGGGDTFGITFVFPSEKREEIEAYVNGVGKAEVAAMIEREAEEWA